MASVKYRISGKHDDKGLKGATKGLKNLGKAAKGINTIFKGFVAFKGVQLLGRQVSKTTQAFATQQKALSNLTQSINNNANLTGKSLQNIIKYTSKLQGKSIYGDEALQEQASLLAGMGLTEEKIKDVLSAAVDLSSSGVGTLESNVRNLSKTLNGQRGELGELIPEFKDLTKEQLESGEAIEIISEKYKGFGESLAGTYEGQQKSFQNVVGDIQEKIGSIFASVQSGFYEKFTPILKKVDEWIGDRAHIFINLFTNLPEIGAVALDALRATFKKYLSADFLKSFGVAFWEFFLKNAQNTFELLFTILKTIGTTIWEPLKAGFDWVVYGIKSAWRGMIDALVNGINYLLTPVNSMIEGLEKIVNMANDAGAALQGFLKHPFNKERREAKIQQLMGQNTDYDFGNVEVSAVSWSKELEKPVNSFAEAGANITEAWSDVGTTLTDVASETWDNMKELGSEIANPIKGVLDEFLPEFNDILQQPVQTVPTTVQTSTGSAGGGDLVSAPRTDAGGGFMDTMKGLLGPLKEFGMGLLEGIAGMKSVMMIMSPLKTILNATLKFLQPLIDSILKPFVGFLQIIGQTIGKMIAPLLQLIEPQLRLISQALIWLYNWAIRPLGNAIIWLITSINNGIAYLINGVINAINKIPFVSVSWRMKKMDYDAQKLDKIDEDDLNTAGNEAYGTSSSSGGASYSGVRDIIVNIYYNNSYVNGDAREIALSIKDELELAGALGY